MGELRDKWALGSEGGRPLTAKDSSFGGKANHEGACPCAYWVPAQSLGFVGAVPGHWGGN